MSVFRQPSAPYDRARHGLPCSCADLQLARCRRQAGAVRQAAHRRRGADTTYEVHGATTVKATIPLAVSHKSAPYDASINEHARRQGVAADLVRAVIQVESAFNPVAVSNKGAMGLMQLMPATALELGVSNPFDPDQNIRGGVTYLKQLLEPLRPEGRTRAGRLQRGHRQRRKIRRACRPSRRPATTSTRSPRPPRRAPEEHHLQVDGTRRRQARCTKLLEQAPASGSYQIVR